MSLSLLTRTLVWYQQTAKWGDNRVEAKESKAQKQPVIIQEYESDRPIIITTHLIPID